MRKLTFGDISAHRPVLYGFSALWVIFLHMSIRIPDSPLFATLWWLKEAGVAGVEIFVLLSGVCATLGSHSVKRGAIVFACGMVCTAVTAGMYFLNMANKGIIIYFGALHCLGACMMLWPLFKKQNNISLLSLGTALVAIGFVLAQMRSTTLWLMPLGLVTADFATGDYFPLLPHLGFFLAGAALGRILYKDKQSLLPRVNGDAPVLRFLQLCGKHSLWIYLLHQPILNGICWLLITYVK